MSQKRKYRKRKFTKSKLKKIVSKQPSETISRPEINSRIDLKDQLIRGLEEDFDIIRCQEDRQTDKKRGRPELIPDDSIRALNKQLSQWKNTLVKKMSKDQRSDAETTTISRHVKKIPDIFLKHIGNTSQYKSPNIERVFRAYLRSFVLGFLKINDCPKGTSKAELFMEYIVL